MPAMGASWKKAERAPSMANAADDECGPSAEDAATNESIGRAEFVLERE